MLFLRVSLKFLKQLVQRKAWEIIINSIYVVFLFVCIVIPLRFLCTVPAAALMGKYNHHSLHYHKVVCFFLLHIKTTATLVYRERRLDSFVQHKLNIKNNKYVIVLYQERDEVPLLLRTRLYTALEFTAMIMLMMRFIMMMMMVMRMMMMLKLPWMSKTN